MGAGPEQGIDDARASAIVHGIAPVDKQGDAKGRGGFPLQGGIPLQLLRRQGIDHRHADARLAQMTRGHQTVAAVVALAGEDQPMLAFRLIQRKAGVAPDASAPACLPADAFRLIPVCPRRLPLAAKPDHFLRDRLAGVFHQRHGRNADLLYGAAIKLPHLRRSYDMHSCLPPCQQVRDPSFSREPTARSALREAEPACLP